MIKSQALSNLYYDLPNHMLNDVEIYETYKIKIINDIKNNNRSFNSIYQIFKNDLDIIMIAVKKNINVLQSIDIKYLDNPYFMTLWNGEFCLQYASNRLKDDKNFVLKLIQEKSPDVFKYASDRLKDDDQIVWATIKQNAGLIQYASDRLKDHDEMIWFVIKKNVGLIEYASARLKDNFDLMKFVVNKNGNLLKYANQLKLNKEIILIAVKNFGKAIEYIRSINLQNDRDIILAAVTSDGSLLKRYGNSPLLNDPEIVLAALKNCPSDQIFNCISYELRKNRNFLLEVIKIDSDLFRCFDPAFKYDREIIMNVVKKNPSSLRYVPTPLQDDIEIISTAIKHHQNVKVLEYVSPRLRDNLKICKMALLRNGTIELQHISTRIKNHPDILYLTLKLNAISFESIPKHLKFDKKFILKLIHDNFSNLKALIPYIQNDLSILRIVIQKDPFTLQPVSDTLKNNRELVQLAIQSNALSLAYASDTLKNDRELVQLAIQSNALSLQYASDTLKNDRELVQLAIQKDPKVLQYAHPNLQEIFKTELIECKSLVEAFLIVAEVKNISIETNELEILKQKTPNQIKDALKIIVLATQKSELDILFKTEN